jgi:hypothetical protein
MWERSSKSMKAATVTRSNSPPMTEGPSPWPKSPPPRFVPSEAKKFTTPAPLSRQPAETNPQGWQRVAGGRSGQRGNDHRKAASDGRAPRKGVPEPWRPDQSSHLTTARPSAPGHLAAGSGTPAGVQDFSRAVARRSPPQKPSATSGYPLATLRVDRSRMSKLQPLNLPALLQPG